MNISPVSMYRNSMSFRCAKCEQKANQPEVQVEKEDKIVGYSSWGGDYMFPVYESQMKAFEQNEKKSQEAAEKTRVSGELEGESLEEYLERHKLEFSM